MQGFEISREDSSEAGAVNAPSEPPSTGGGPHDLSPELSRTERGAEPVRDRRIGQVIDGKYHVLRRLACGGMGSVYEARHAVVGRHVALKFLHEQYAQRSCMVQRFLREAQAAGSIASENIIGVLDYGSAEGTPYLVMELVRGQDLREILAESPRLPAGRAVRIVIDACRGLALAHERGLVHRDLKPANICVTRQSDGREVAKVIDFGVAKLRDGAELSEEGTLIGTLGYMAPEQLTDQKQLDARADIYALGVILYQALAGRPPHICNRSELLYRIVSVDPKPLGELCPELPQALCAVVHKALCRSKERRYASVRELAAALEPFALDVPAAEPREHAAQVAASGASAPTRYEPASTLLRDEPTSPSRHSRVPALRAAEAGGAGPPTGSRSGESVNARPEPGWTTFTRDGQLAAGSAPAGSALPFAEAREVGARLGTAETELGSSPTWAALTPTSSRRGADRQCEPIAGAPLTAIAQTGTHGVLVEQYCRHPDGLPAPVPPRHHHHLSQRALLLSVGALALSVVATTTMFIFVYSHGSGALESAATASSRAAAPAREQRASLPAPPPPPEVQSGGRVDPALAAAGQAEHCEVAGALHGTDRSGEGSAGDVTVQQHALRPGFGLGAYPGVRAIACE